MTSLDQFILPITRSDWDQLLADWRPLIPEGASPWLLTKFGELFFVESNGKIGMLQVSSFSYAVVAKDENDFIEWLVDPDKLTEWFLAPLLRVVEAQGKTLPPGKCYSFVTPLGLGGSLKPENVMVVPIEEHFKCFGEIFRQIKDLPDGAQIQLKVN